MDVTANGSVVTATIDERHAWAAILSRQGADLVAEYTMPGSGLVREVVAGSSPVGERGLRFMLPEQVKGVPAGPVCLYIQARANRSVVPVRKKPVEGDTGRFRVQPWEQSLRVRADAMRAKAERVALDQRVDAAGRAVVARTASIQARGWMEDSTCQGVRGPEAGATLPPIGVLPVDQHDAAARRTCVNRVLYSQRLRQHFVQRISASKNDAEFKEALSTASQLAGMGESAAALALRVKPGDDPKFNQVLSLRQQEARSFLADLQRFSAQIGTGFYPAFGKTDDYMTLVSQARPVHARALLLEQAERANLPVESRPVLTGNDQLALSSGMIDAYLGCVSDGARELQVKLQAWTELQRDAPDRNRRIREHLVQECRGQHAALAALRADAARLGQEQQQMAADQTAAARSAAPPAEATAALALNARACTADR